MAASTGTALFPGASTFPNTSGVTPGQGTLPLIRVRVTFDDASVAAPVWSDLTSRVRSYEINRGRNSELELFDAGTASVVFDNRDRTLDPNSNASVRPLNRLWIYEEFSGEVHDLFHGYAESWEQGYDQSGIYDATAMLRAADEFKVLSLSALPVTNPPRDTYAEVIAFDNPSGYWRMGDGMPSGVSYSVQGSPGPALSMVTIAGTSSISGLSQNNSAIVGDATNFATALGNGSGTGTNGYLASELNPGDGGDVVGGTEVTIESWVNISTVPAGTHYLIIGPSQGAVAKYELQIVGSSGLARFTARNSSGTAFTATGTIALLPNTWYHVVGTVQSGNVRIYVNGSQQASTAFSGVFSSSLAAGAGINVGDPAGTIPTVEYDEVAFYPFGLTASRIQAHYDAGVNRGFADQPAGARIGAVLDAASNRAPRRLDAGVRTVADRFMRGDDPKSAITEAEQAEAVDSGFFIAGDGTARFLASNHRSSSPYNTVQATYGDGGGAELPYLDIALDYSESFLFNEWNVTRDGGEVQTSSDATSITRYFKRSQSLTGLALTSDSDSSTVAAAMLAKYKDPMQRVTSISPNMADANTILATYQRELMDRIEVLRRPPGGGSPIDQQLFIQSIKHSGSPGAPPSCTLGVSPL